MTVELSAKALDRHIIPHGEDTRLAAEELTPNMEAGRFRVFQGRFLEPGVTLEVLAKELGITSERVRQIECRIARRLRHKRLEITESRKPPAERRIGTFNVSVRVANALENDDIETLGQLAETCEGRLLRVPNFGRKSLAECRDLLALHGTAFAVGVPVFGPEHGGM